MKHRQTNGNEGISWPLMAAEPDAITGPNHTSLSRSLPALEQVAGYLSIREAARMLGVSERSVYGYLHSGRLAGGKIGDLIVVNADALADFERRAPGRIRSTTPRWHVPPERNQHFCMTITLRLYPGQEERLHHLLDEMRRTNRHSLPGTAARYLVHNQANPDEIELILFWRGAILPSADQRASALAALAADLADVLNWEHATVKEGHVLLHAYA